MRVTIRLTDWSKALFLCLMLLDSQAIYAGIWTLKELPDEKKGVVAFSLQKNVVYVGNPQNTGLSEQDGFTVLTLHTGQTYILTSDHMELASIDFGFPVFHEFRFMDGQIVPTDYVAHQIRIRSEIRELKEKEKKTEEEKKDLEDKQSELNDNIRYYKDSFLQEQEKNKKLKQELDVEKEKNRDGKARSKSNAQKKNQEERERERLRLSKIRELQEENIELSDKVSESEKTKTEVEILKAELSDKVSESETTKTEMEILKAELSKVKAELSKTKVEKKQSEKSDDNLAFTKKGSSSNREAAKAASSERLGKTKLIKNQEEEKPKATIEPTVLNIRPAVKTVCDEGGPGYNPGYVEMEPIKRYEKGEVRTMADPARKWVKDAASSVKNAAVAGWPLLMKLGFSAPLIYLSSSGIYWAVVKYLINSLEKEKEYYRKSGMNTTKQSKAFTADLTESFELDYSPMPIGRFTGDPLSIVFFSKVVYSKERFLYSVNTGRVDSVGDCKLIKDKDFFTNCLYFYLQKEFRIAAFMLLLYYYHNTYDSKKHNVVYSKLNVWSSVSEWYYGRSGSFVEPVYYGNFIFDSYKVEKLFSSKRVQKLAESHQPGFMAAAYLYCPVTNESEEYELLERCIECLLDIYLNSRTFIAGYSQIEVILEDMRPLPYSMKGLFLFLHGIYQSSEGSSLKFDHFKPTLFSHEVNEFTVSYLHGCKKALPVLFSGFPDREYDLLTYDEPGFRWDILKNLNLSAMGPTDPILRLCDGSYWLRPSSSEDTHFYFVIYKGKVYQYKPLGRMMEH